MPAKKKKNDKPLVGKALIKEVNRRIRAARNYWDAHNNRLPGGAREGHGTLRNPEQGAA